MLTRIAPFEAATLDVQSWARTSTMHRVLVGTVSGSIYVVTVDTTDTLRTSVVQLAGTSLEDLTGSRFGFFTLVSASTRVGARQMDLTVEDAHTGEQHRVITSVVTDTTTV